MASLLVYVDSERLQSILPIRQAGAVWPMRAADFRDAELDRLDELSTLFVVTLDGERAVLVAFLDAPRIGRDGLGDAAVCDADITHLLPRLGCARAADVPAWANLPRVLPPGDVDVLTVRPPPPEPVALPRPAPPPAPLQIVAEDPKSARLLAAIYEDLGSDVARTVYADYLQEQGDPRGELIALQLARHASGRRVSERERELYDACARHCVGPLLQYLLPGFVLRRGFLAACAGASQQIPDRVIRDITWSTVEELHTTNLALLQSSALVSAWRLGTNGRALARASGGDRELPFEVIVGDSSRFGPQIVQKGMLCMGEDWDVLAQVGALVRVRAISASTLDPDRATELARSKLGKQLRHLDLFLGSAPVPDADLWRRMFDRTALHRLTLRCSLEPVRRPRPHEVVGPWNVGQTLGPYTCIALERTTGQHRLVAQVEAALSAAQVTQAVRLIAQLARHIDRIEVQDLVEPDHLAERQPGLLAALAPMFARVLPTAGPLLAP